MARKFEKDRFDTPNYAVQRVGAHRAPITPRRRWMGLWWALGATVVLIVVGVVGIFAINDRLDFSNIPALSPSTAPSSPPEAAVPTVDPAALVTVLNGSENDGVAASVSDILTAAGWVVSVTGNASSDSETATTVYYAVTSQEGAARGVSESIPNSTIAISPNFADSGADITVVVGNDYVIPTS